jgi:lipopolysaccharide export system protein LptA
VRKTLLASLVLFAQLGAQELTVEYAPRPMPPVPVGPAALDEGPTPEGIAARRDADERNDFFFVDNLGPGELGFAVDALAGWIEYRVAEERLILNVNARVAYDELRLSADTVVYEGETGEVEALGAPVLVEGDERVDGERMRYNFDTGRGIVYEGRTGLETGFATGKKLKLQGEEILHIADATFTTSTRPSDPEYHFWCPKLKVYSGDKVVARPVVLFIGHVPVGLAPFYYYPLGRDRRSGFLAPRLSYRAHREFSVRNAYFWAVNDYADATFALDYDTAHGWRQEIEGRYLYGTERGMNWIRAVHDEDRLRSKEHWSFTGQHRQDLPWEVNGLLKLTLRTDRFYDQYYSEYFEERTRRDLDSFLSLSRSWENFSGNVGVDYTATLVDEGGEEVESRVVSEVEGELGPATWTVPKVSLSMSQTELLGSGAFLSTRFNYYNRLREGTTPFRTAGLDAHLSRPFSLFRWFKFTPYLDGSLDWYRTAADGSLNHVQPLYSAGIAGSTRIFGLFYPGDDELRHVVEPSAGLSWRPEIDTENVPSGGQTQSPSTLLSLGLTNRLKLRRGGGVELDSGSDTDYGSSGQAVELLRWDLSTGYVVDSPEPVDEPWNDLVSRVYVTPVFAEWYDSQIVLSSRHDLYTYQTESFDLSASFALSGAGARPRLEDNEYDEPTDEIPDYEPLETEPPRDELEKRIASGWRVGLTYDYTMSFTGGQDIHFLGLQAIFNLTDNWRLSYTTSMDLVGGDLVRQTFSIYRDLRSWEARLRLEESRGVITVWFLIDIKDIPDIRIEGRPALY